MKPQKLDFSAIKASTDIARVIERYGVSLKAEGKDQVGLCPFHDDHEPSLRVTPAKGLFRCMSCGAKGNVIQFVARKEGIPDKEAALKLLGSIPTVTRGSALPETTPPVETPQPTPPRLENPSELLQRVTAFYARTLSKDRAGLDYLKSRRLDDPAMLEAFGVGYCNGTLRQALPREGAIIEQLKELGILNESGNECFYGRVVVPILDGAGNVCGLYGRRLTDEKPRHLYLKGKLGGVCNGIAAKTNQTLFITEALFDAMSLWSAGFHNVISLYGNQGWTAHHETLLKENGITTVYLALDNDERSREATQKLKEKLETLSLAVHVIQWPEGVKDANEFFLSRGSEEFRKLLPQPCPAVESPATAGEKDRMTLTAQGFNWTTGGRLYDLCAIEKPSLGRLKATIKAMPSRALMDQASRLFFIDTVDFYLSRSRKAFVAEAARLFRETPEIIEEDVNQIILAVENYIAQTAENPVPVAITIPEGDRLEALRMLRSAGLIDEIQRDLGKLGLIGEEPNRLLLYLGMTSRKMDDPLAIQILSSSGAGKSYLQDAVLSLCPEEDLIKLTSLSGQALFYKGENSLKHKCLAIAEVAGAEGARYALRNLISDKKLTIESTVKNGMTGKLETQINLVWGPTAVFETTTNPKTDAETKSRYFLASVNESPEQTKAILEAQRNSHTLEGRKRKQTRLKITAKHHALQRLLEPITVVNPYEPLLTYGEDRLAFRRDQPKYLNLILTVTFLHQMQRPRKHDPELGDYIEVTLDDIAIANELAHRLFGQSLDDLSAPSREALDRITGYVEKKSRELKCEREKVEFSRRELREVFGWSDTRLRVYLGELVDMEYLAPVSGRNGMRFCYRLIDGGTPGERRIPGLKDVETLRKEAELSGIVQPLHLAAREENPAALNGHLAATPPQTNGEVKKGYDPRRNGHRPHPPAAAQETLVEIYG